MSFLDKLVSDHIEMFALTAFEQFRIQGRGAISVFLDTNGKHDAVHYVPYYILAEPKSKLPDNFTFMVEVYRPDQEFVIIAEGANNDLVASTVEFKYGSELEKEQG